VVEDQTRSLPRDFEESMEMRTVECLFESRSSKLFIVAVSPR